MPASRGDEAAGVGWVVAIVAWRKEFLKLGPANPILAVEDEGVELALMNGFGDGGGVAGTKRGEVDVEAWRVRWLWRRQGGGSGKNIHPIIL